MTVDLGACCRNGDDDFKQRQKMIFGEENHQ